VNSAHIVIREEEGSLRRNSKWGSRSGFKNLKERLKGSHQVGEIKISSRHFGAAHFAILDDGKKTNFPREKRGSLVDC